MSLLPIQDELEKAKYVPQTNLTRGPILVNTPSAFLCQQPPIRAYPKPSLCTTIKFSPSACHVLSPNASDGDWLPYYGKLCINSLYSHLSGFSLFSQFCQHKVCIAGYFTPGHLTKSNAHRGSLCPAAHGLTSPCCSDKSEQSVKSTLFKLKFTFQGLVSICLASLVKSEYFFFLSSVFPFYIYPRVSFVIKSRTMGRRQAADDKTGSTNPQANHTNMRVCGSP